MSKPDYREIPGMFAGPILPVTLRVGLPLLIGQVLQFVYAIVDTYFISLIDQSSTALISGTGLMFPVFFIIVAVSVSLSVGVSTLVGRAVGERNRAVVRHVSASALLLAVLLALPLVTLGYLFADRFVRLMSGDSLSQEALGYGRQIFRAALPGLGVTVVAQTLYGILQGQGLTALIARSAVLATVTNIVLDPLFIFGLDLGVAGAGAATSVAATVSALYVMTAFLRGQSHVPLSFAVWRARAGLVREILRIGLPQFLNMASLSVAFMALNKLVSGIGQSEMNSWTLAARMDYAVLIPSFAVAGANSVMVSQNYGRNQLDRVRRIYVCNVGLGAGVVAAVAVAYMSLAPLLFGSFSAVAEVVAAATHQVRLLALTFVGVSVSIVSGSTFQASGRPLPALALVVVRMGLVALPLAAVLVLALGAGMTGVYVASGAGNLVALPLGLAWTLRHLRRLRFRAVA
jgi:putative MATE family efflux protein